MSLSHTVLHLHPMIASSPQQVIVGHGVDLEISHVEQKFSACHHNLDLYRVSFRGDAGIGSDLVVRDQVLSQVRQIINGSPQHFRNKILELDENPMSHINSGSVYIDSPRCEYHLKLYWAPLRGQDPYITELIELRGFGGFGVIGGFIWHA